MKRLTLLTCVPAIALSLVGCAGHADHVLGAAPPQAELASIRTLKPVDAPVTLHGTMIEKCPVAGCWFMLRDKTGVIKIDTKGAGFVVSSVPLNTEVTVRGTLMTTGERRIAATGMRF